MVKKVIIIISVIFVSAIFYKKINKPVEIGKSNRQPKSVTLCPRNGIGDLIKDTIHLYSKNGVLELQLNYETDTDESGNTRYCFITPNGDVAPTFHVNPGDRIILHVTNHLPVPNRFLGLTMKINSKSICNNNQLDETSVNVHYHGANIPPTCKSDQIIYTLINSGEKYTYDFKIPKDEPPGLYWYHAHVHGHSEVAVLGGATGIFIVEGLENVVRGISQIPQRFFTIRDNLVPGSPTDDTAPSWDISVNHHPIPWPKYEAPVVEMLPNNRELWRVANTSANSIIDIKLIYDGATQPLEVVAIDAVPTGTEDPGGLGKPIVRDHFLLPPAGRVEFIMKGPSLKVKKAQLLAMNVDTGPIGDSDPERPILNIKASTQAKPTMTLPKLDRSEKIKHAFGRFRGLFKRRVAKSRKLYFSQVLSDPNDSESPTDFFITEEGATPTLFNSNNPPSITVKQNSIEDWTIENRTQENHEFHIHQIHFLLIEQNGKKVSRSEKQFYDTIQVPYWSGSGPYPSIKIRMDFRGDIVGEFLYHCHILAHEDSGMMAKISVIP